jgi:hypothetical protein
MDRNERLLGLLGPKPTKQLIKKATATLDAVSRMRAERLNAKLRLERKLNEASFVAQRELIKGHQKITSKIASMNKKAHKSFLAHVKASKRLKLLPKRRIVKPRVRLGSISATFVPPFIPWTWQGGQMGDTTESYNANKNTGEISLWAANSGAGSTNIAGALGAFFQPPYDEGAIVATASPAIGYDFQTQWFADSAYAGGFFGLYVGEYDLNGQFSQAVVDQQINYSGTGGYSAYPLFAQFPADSEHYYLIWVWTGVSISADGYHWLYYSWASASAQVNVPWITATYYS